MEPGQKRRHINYEIRMENSSDTIKGSLRVNANQSINSIREEIQKMNSFASNHLVVESPQTLTLPDNILLVILKEKKVNNYRKYSDTSSIYFEQQSMIERNESHEYIYHEPEAPPKVIGRVRECFKIFSCFSSERTMILNFEAVKFVQGNVDKTGRVNRTIPLSSIEEVKPFKKKDFYFIRIKTFNNEKTDLRFLNKDVCKQWINYFHQAINYHEYLEERQNYSRNQSFKNFVKTLLEKDDKKIVKLEDSTMVPKNSQDFGILSSQPSNIKKSSRKYMPRLADFEVTHKIGSGAFSNVFKVIHTQSNKIYALKQMHKDELLYKNQMKYAMTELSILKNCHHCPFIINFGYAFQTEDYLYLALKYTPFGNLKQILNEKHILSFDIAYKILCQLVVAIEYLHERKILYRDLKPQNIMLNGDGHISLIDFGLSIQLDQSTQFAESFVGTPLYIAPQRLQGSGKVNFKADIYGVGCIFYQMLHGKAPYQAESLSSIIYNIKNTSIQTRSDLSEMAKIFIHDTLQKNVDKRTSHLSSHPFFEGVDWKKLQRREVPIMKLKQRVEGHFEVKNLNDHDYTEANYPNKKIADWIYSPS